MVDGPQKVGIQAELDASQVKTGAAGAAQALRDLLGLVNQLESQTRSLFTGQSGQLNRQLSDLTRQLQDIQRLPLQAAQVGRLNRQIAGGGGSTSANNAAMSGVMANIRTDPALQNLKVEGELNKVLAARAEIYRRVREALPDGATALRTSQAYRQALATIGDMPERGTEAYRTWQKRTLSEVHSFEKDWTRMAGMEQEKRQREQLRITRETMTSEQRLAREHQREMTRLFRRDMNGVMTGATPEQRRAMAGESVGRMRDYAGRRGMTGFNEQQLLEMYEDAEARRSARDLTRRPPAAPRVPMTDEQRAGRAYQQRDAFMNYNGGANRLASRFQFVGDFAAVGAVMGTAMYAGRSTVQLQTELKNLQAITKSTDSEMKSLQGTIFAVGQTTKYSTTQIAEAATVMGQAGYSAAQIKEALPAIANLATAAGGDLADTVSTVTSVLSIYDMSIDRTVTVSNQLAEALNGSKLSFQQLSLGLQYAGNVAADGGVQFEELTAALGAMSNAGIRSGSTLGTGLRALVQELENPNDKFIEWLRSVGLTADDVDIRTQGLAGALNNLTAKSFDSGTAMNMFEIRAASAFSALSNNIDVMTELEQDMQNTTAATDAAGTQMETVQAQATRMGNALTELTTVAGAPLLAFLQGAIGALASMMSAMAGAGPIIQVVTTALAFMIALGVGKWLLTMAAGFVGLTPALLRAQVGMVALNFQVGGFSAVAGLATQSIKALTLALLASPLGLITVAMTALVTIFTLHEAAAARSAEKLDEWRTKANAAAAESQKFGDRVEELGTFMEMVAARSNSLASESAFAGQMAETAAAKFAEWGLVLEGNITTVDQLIEKLATLSNEQATAALNQKELEKEAKIGERDTLAGERPWAEARRKNILWQSSVARYEQLGQGSMEQSITPAMRGLLDKMQRGPLTQFERDRLSGMIRAQLPRMAATPRRGAQELLNQLNGETINSLFQVNGQIERLDRDISTLRVGASPQMQAAQVYGNRQQRDTAERQQGIARTDDPAARVGLAATEQRRNQALSQQNDVFLGNLADQMLRNDPSIAQGLSERARLSGTSVRDLLIAQMRRQSPGYGRTSLLAGDDDALDTPAAIRSRERMLKAQIADAGSISDPGRRDSTRQGLQTQLTDVTRRRLALDNPDLDAITLESMLQDEVGRGGADMNRTQETSEQRANRDRSNTLKRQVKTIEGRIEATTINTRPTAGTAGSPDEQRAMQFLMQKGLTANQAAGIVGNLVVESNMNTQALGDNGSAYGLGQWRFDRQDALRSFARGRGTEASDFDTQMEFLWKEAQERGDLDAVRGQDTVAGAAEQFARKYERPVGANGPLSELGHWDRRLAAGNRLAGSGSVTEIDQSELQGLLDEWKTTNIQQITAEGRAANISDAEMQERLADFEVTAQEYFNDVLTGNATKMKQLLADASERSADGYAAQMQSTLRVGGKDLDEAIAEIQAGYNVAVEAALEASDAEFRAKDPGVDPSISAEAGDARREIQDNFAQKIVDSTLAAIDAFFEGEAERAANEVDRLRLGIERESAMDSRIDNANGSRRIGNVQRALAGRRGEERGIRSGGVDVYEAQGNYDRAVAEQRRLEEERAATTSEEGRTALDERLAVANANVQDMADAMERAQNAFEAMAGEAPQFTSFTQAWQGAMAVFADQAGLTKGVFEDMSDGMLNALNATKDGFKTMVMDVATGTKTMGGAFKDFTMTILQSLLDMAAEIMTKQALIWIMKFVMQQTGGSEGNFAFLADYLPTPGKKAWHGGPIRMAGGGRIPGTDSSRDSVLINAMPGEVMMSKSAVDMVGEENLLAMNARANSRVSKMPSMADALSARQPDEVNVWVVAPEKRPAMGKKDVVAIMTEDMMTGGQTKQLIKAIAVGGL
jgi:TP901 family phage tail tape measure protein